MLGVGDGVARVVRTTGGSNTAATTNALYATVNFGSWVGGRGRFPSEAP